MANFGHFGPPRAQKAPGAQNPPKRGFWAPDPDFGVREGPERSSGGLGNNLGATASREREIQKTNTYFDFLVTLVTKNQN